MTAVNTLPFSQGWDVPTFTAEGQTVSRAEENPSLSLESIDPGYFETFDVRLVAGRSFTDADRADTPDVAIVSEDVAARTWPGENPLGKRMSLLRKACSAEFLPEAAGRARVSGRDAAFAG